MVKLRLVRDSGPTVWLNASLNPETFRVCSIVPDGLPAYVRILQRPVLGDGTTSRWSAFSGGANIAPGRLFDELFPAEAAGGAETCLGSLHAADMRALVPILKNATGAGGYCWVAVWDGYGGGESWKPTWPAPVHMPGRDYYLFRGTLDGLLDPPWQEPPFGPDTFGNLIWPDDHSWVVASEIDLDSTYVGGPVSLIEAILNHPELETTPASVDDPV